MDKKITDFIGEHHVLTITTSDNNQPYTANCFFVYDKENISFLFTSDPKTRHGIEMLQNSKVAANIVLETKAVGKIQGLQITGEVEALTGSADKKAKLKYLKSYPYAILKLETMWELKVNFYKLTDNRLGFGKKLIWKKSEG
ncbi:MAG: pyridoxamine 5'-phosphate oxidase family protein [Bacteroidales bacterium]|nr:pyridoxamine 5'-phosphate oxidase family protein [Bacteroidales bacterium]